MSRWANFGFPDLRLVSPLTALTGLELALIERNANMAIPHVADYHLLNTQSTGNNGWLSLLIFFNIWNFALYDYVDPTATGSASELSDRHRFTAANLPQILGESRVLPTGKLVPVMNRDYISQCYRIINLAYKQVRYDDEKNAYIYDCSAEFEFLDL